MKQSLLEEGKAHEAVGVDGDDGVTVEVVDISYGVMGPNKKLKRLLKNVSLTLKSGTMCALMGPSGAGKR